jgi:hypothetical protein
LNSHVTAVDVDGRLVCDGGNGQDDSHGCVPALIVKVAALDVPPPGVGFFTVTLAVPAVRMLAAGICALNCVLFTNAVGCAAPFRWTAGDEIKSVPFTVRVNAGPPAMAFVGEMFETDGNGFAAAMMSNAIAGEVSPPGDGFVTVT